MKIKFAHLKPMHLSAYKAKTISSCFSRKYKRSEQDTCILQSRKELKWFQEGAGTGLSGGALPLADSILLCLGKFNKILDIDYKNRCVVAQPGVTNLSITASCSG